jgi:hypothetical protein
MVSAKVLTYSLSVLDHMSQQKRKKPTVNSRSITKHYDGSDQFVVPFQISSWKTRTPVLFKVSETRL